MKKTKLAKKGKTKISVFKRKLWKVVSKRIKERDKYICYTSKVKVSGSNAHCGHGLPSSVCGARLRYHPKNLHCQSYRENVNAGGNGAIYYQEQVKQYGQKAVNKLYALQNKFIDADETFYELLTGLYETGTWEDIEYFLEN